MSHFSITCIHKFSYLFLINPFWKSLIWVALQCEYVLNPELQRGTCMHLLWSYKKFKMSPKMGRLISTRSSNLHTRNRRKQVVLFFLPRKLNFFPHLLDSSFKKLLTTMKNNTISPLGGVEGIEIQLAILLLEGTI